MPEKKREKNDKTILTKCKIFLCINRDVTAKVGETKLCATYTKPYQY